ncbi:MAG: hypothetical protein JST11_00475, partial [Acidobacteria bacterium]|nr:hypothetical protein [Acidobacteriota bacterium]
MRWAIPFLLTATACAQTYSSHSGWNFADTLQTASDVLVGDIVSGSAVDDGSQVSVKATLRVVRVLGGNAVAGSVLAIQWQYRPAPLESPAVTSTVPRVTGLWFLRRAEGKLQPLQASVMMSRLGGFYLPAGDAPRYYSASAPVPYKIACEIAPVIESLVARHGDDLGPHAPQAPVAGAPPEWVQTVTQFRALTMALQGLGKNAAEAYAYFSSMPDPRLKLIGIQGRLETGDASALFDLEKDFGVIAPVLNGGSMPMTGMGIDVRVNLPAAHALGRLAIGETPLPGIEGGAASQLASTRSPEFLPYLIVMLGSPSPSTRDLALMSFCQLLRDGKFWTAEMPGYCPNRAPLNDPATEQKDIRFWREWWQAHRVEIAKTVALPGVSAPARYNIPENTNWQPVEIPMEIRFMSLLNMAGSQSGHYHDAGGALVQGPSPGPHDPVAPQLTPADRESYEQVCTAMNAKLAAIQKRSEEILNAARVAGTFPPVIADDRLPALKSGLDDLRNRLSPAGWRVVERFLN